MKIDDKSCTRKILNIVSAKKCLISRCENVGHNDFFTLHTQTMN